MRNRLTNRLARLGLAGLIAGAVVAATPAGAQGFFQDEMLNMKVAAKLQFNKALLREKIDVKTVNGIVTLSGGVSSKEAISLAGKLAAETAGVVKVNNFLRVGPPDASN